MAGLYNLWEKDQNLKQCQKMRWMFWKKKHEMQKDKRATWEELK